MSPRHQTRSFIALIVATAAASGILYGYNLGVIAGANLFVVDEFALSPTLKEIATSASLFGSTVGAIAGGKFADRFGRLGALFSVALMVGLLVAYVVDLSLSSVEHGWRRIFLFGMAPACRLSF